MPDPTIPLPDGKPAEPVAKSVAQTIGDYVHDRATRQFGECPEDDYGSFCNDVASFVVETVRDRLGVPSARLLKAGGCP